MTISTAFAFAILLRCGPGPAALVYVSSSVIADLAGRLAPLKVLFNAAQYLLALLAAGAVLLIAHSFPLITITLGGLGNSRRRRRTSRPPSTGI